MRDANRAGCWRFTGLLIEDNALWLSLVNVYFILFGSYREIPGIQGEIAGGMTGHSPLKYELPISLERASLTSQIRENRQRCR